VRRLMPHILTSLVVGTVFVGALAGCADSAPTTSTSGPTSNAATSDLEVSDASTAALEGAVERVLVALRDRDHATLAELVDPDEGVVFLPYSYSSYAPDVTAQIVDAHDRMSPEEVGRLGTSGTTRVWGTYEGRGDPIELTVDDYWVRFVWDRDYLDAPSVAVDHSRVPSAWAGIPDVFGPTARWVECAFPDGEDPDVGGLDWSALNLVFRETVQIDPATGTVVGTTYGLIAVIHGEHEV